MNGWVKSGALFESMDMKTTKLMKQKAGSFRVFFFPCEIKGVRPMCCKCCPYYSVCSCDSGFRLFSRSSGLGVSKCLYFLALLLNFGWGWMNLFHYLAAFYDFFLALSCVLWRQRHKQFEFSLALRLFVWSVNLINQTHKFVHELGFCKAFPIPGFSSPCLVFWRISV